MTILYVSANEVTTASAIGGDTEDTLFPAVNLGSGDPAEIFRFNTAASGDFRYVDLGSAKNLNFASVHFHNIDSGVTTIQIQSDTTSAFSTPTTRVTMTERNPSFFATWNDATSEQFYRILFNGTNTSGPIYMGEWWLGTTVAFTDTQKYGWEVKHMMNQQRTGKFPKRERAVNLAEDGFPTRQLNMDFIPTTVAIRDEGLTFWNAANWGQDPVVLVPDDTDTIAIHGRVINDWTWTSEEAGLFPYSMEFSEDPGPVLVK